MLLRKLLNTYPLYWLAKMVERTDWTNDRRAVARRDTQHYWGRDETVRLFPHSSRKSGIKSGSHVTCDAMHR
jgi:hypothetical protein